MCTNLLRILGLTQFPQRDIDTEVDTTQGECSICFTVRSDDDMSLAIKVCNNTRCDSYFHISCLAQVSNHGQVSVQKVISLNLFKPFDT